jgi:GxxExxY protein
MLFVVISYLSGGFMEIEAVATQIVDAAVKVHRTLGGPGLLESTYQACLAYELHKRGLQVATEVAMPVVYEGQRIEAGYRIDMLIENSIIIENKAVTEVLPIHYAQLITYLKMSGCKIGFMINWNVKLIKNGLERFAN